MFRSPQILAFPCPLRPLLLGVRDPRIPALSEHTCVRWLGTRAGKHLPFSTRDEEMDRRGGGAEGEISLSKETITSRSTLSTSSLDYEIRQLKATAPQNHLIPKAALSIQPQLTNDSVSSKPRLFLVWQAFPPWKSVIDLAQNPKAPSTYHDCSNDIKCLQPQGRPWNISRPSLSIATKTLSNPVQSHLFHRVHFLRSFSSSTHRPWSLNVIQRTPPPSSLYMPQIRALHRAAAPREAASPRDCLSPENEERCRRSLGPNLKLYDGDNRGRRGTGQTLGKGRRKWASILVSLCSVKGEPAFLFTLRSSTLKGRHKGDVRSVYYGSTVALD